MRLRPRTWLATLGFAGATGCLPQQPSRPSAPTSAVTAASEWPAAYAQALAEARESRLGLADRTLADFAQRFPDSREAAEVAYWRAVYKLDPNQTAATREALVLLESYLASSPGGLHRVEAMAFRRLITVLEARTATLAAHAAAPIAKPDETVHEEELARLRDELGRANAELARIKRRLARPN